MLKIELKEIPIRDIVAGYLDLGYDGVTGYNGKLNVRPAYQREFVYSGKQREAVMETILKGFPLNIMYWCENEDGTYEILDGQQRTISFCQFVANEYMITHRGTLRTFDSMSQDDRDAILNYKCMIYICKGTHSEKLEWFRVINTGGEELYDQELRNACYTGKWLTDAKLKFSKPSCPAYSIGSKYLTGSPIRQDYLETTLNWIRQKKNMSSIEEYMLRHQNDANSLELWNYFSSVINWTVATFPKYRSQMKGVPWGVLYNNYGETVYDSDEMEEKVKALMIDDEVENKKGIYEFVFDGLEKHLNLRQFSEAQKIKAHTRQGGKCPRCAAMNKPTKNKIWAIEEMEGDHITPWHEGGKTEDSNCQMLCKSCNREKGGR